MNIETINGIKRREFLRRLSQVGVLGVTSLAPNPFTRLLAHHGPIPMRSGGHVPPFNVVVLGDSIAWGQGLSASEKYPARVAAWLRQELTDVPGVNVFSYARSGAVIQPSSAHDAAITSWGASTSDAAREVPNDYPSITRQVDLAFLDLMSRRIGPFDVDLVLLDGGINDVGVMNILTVDPTIWDKPAQIRDWTRRKCGDRMRTLLTRTLEVFPRAHIVVTNYFPIVSRQSPLTEVGGLLTAFGLLKAGPIEAAIGAALTIPLRDALADQSAAFHEESTTVLGTLVSEANAESKRVAFADVGFGPENAYGAPQTYLFRVGENDPVRTARETQCRIALPVLDPKYPKCLNASMGHPNQLGAQRYAESIISQLQILIPECAS